MLSYLSKALNSWNFWGVAFFGLILMIAFGVNFFIPSWISVILVSLVVLYYLGIYLFEMKSYITDIDGHWLIYDLNYHDTPLNLKSHHVNGRELCLAAKTQYNINMCHFQTFYTSITRSTDMLGFLIWSNNDKYPYKPQINELLNTYKLLVKLDKEINDIDDIKFKWTYVPKGRTVRVTQSSRKVYGSNILRKLFCAIYYTLCDEVTNFMFH